MPRGKTPSSPAEPSLEELLAPFGAVYIPCGPDEYFYTPLTEERGGNTKPEIFLFVRARYKRPGLDERATWVMKLVTTKSELETCIRRAEDSHADQIEVWQAEAEWEQIA